MKQRHIQKDGKGCLGQTWGGKLQFGGKVGTTDPNQFMDEYFSVGTFQEQVTIGNFYQ